MSQSRSKKHIFAPGAPPVVFGMINDAATPAQPAVKHGSAQGSASAAAGDFTSSDPTAEHVARRVEEFMDSPLGEAMSSPGGAIILDYEPRNPDDDEDERPEVRNDPSSVKATHDMVQRFYEDAAHGGGGTLYTRFYMDGGDYPYAGVVNSNYIVSKIKDGIDDSNIDNKFFPGDGMGSPCAVRVNVSSPEQLDALLASDGLQEVIDAQERSGRGEVFDKDAYQEALTDAYTTWCNNEMPDFYLEDHNVAYYDEQGVIDEVMQGALLNGTVTDYDLYMANTSYNPFVKQEHNDIIMHAFDQYFDNYDQYFDN